MLIKVKKEYCTRLNIKSFFWNFSFCTALVDMKRRYQFDTKMIFAYYASAGKRPTKCKGVSKGTQNFCKTFSNRLNFKSTELSKSAF